VKTHPSTGVNSVPLSYQARLQQTQNAKCVHTVDLTVVMKRYSRFFSNIRLGKGDQSSSSLHIFLAISVDLH
jgi:hypothetical protein